MIVASCGDDEAGGRKSNGGDAFDVALRHANRLLVSSKAKAKRQQVTHAVNSPALSEYFFRSEDPIPGRHHRGRQWPPVLHRIGSRYRTFLARVPPVQYDRRWATEFRSCKYRYRQ